MSRVYLGLGANLGDREGTIRRALAALDGRIGHVLAASRLYETEPWGVADQPRFLNAACALCTALEPEPLLAALQRLERALGRVPSIRHGPRAIDLDILLYDTCVLHLPRLTIPHPGMLQRASVLVPLAEIAPDLVHPISGRTVRAHLAELGAIAGVAPYPPGLGPLVQI